MKKLPVSLVVITLNEEQNILRCLKSALWVDEIIVLDNGSQDRTLDIARSLGAQVFQEPWRGFGLQKRRAVELAKNDWVLCLDADEELSPALSREIQELYIEKIGPAESAKLKTPHDGYFMARKAFFLGRWIMHGGWYPDRQLRFFDRRRCNWSPDALHESVQSLAAGFLKNDLHHYTFRSLFQQVQTNNQYSTLALQKLVEKKHQFVWHQLLIKPFVKFFECYFIKLGFMDGIQGFIIAVGASYSHFLRYAKLWEATVLKNPHILIKSNTKLDGQPLRLQSSSSLETPAP